VLVPATMTLPGRWNWHLPSFLDRLPHISVEHDAAEPSQGGGARV
jgi:putative drug exporter of the RND superfamily